jgi:hypothetical protein
MKRREFIQIAAHLFDQCRLLIEKIADRLQQRLKPHALANEDVIEWMFSHQEVLRALLDDLDGIDLDDTDATAEDEHETA